MLTIVDAFKMSKHDRVNSKIKQFAKDMEFNLSLIHIQMCIRDKKYGIKVNSNYKLLINPVIFISFKKFVTLSAFI